MVRESLRGLIHVPFHVKLSGSQIMFFDPQEEYSAEPKRRAVRGAIKKDPGPRPNRG